MQKSRLRSSVSLLLLIFRDSIIGFVSVDGVLASMSPLSFCYFFIYFGSLINSSLRGEVLDFSFVIIIARIL